jgi:hypothetical protein
MMLVVSLSSLSRQVTHIIIRDSTNVASSYALRRMQRKPTAHYAQLCGIKHNLKFRIVIGMPLLFLHGA